MIGNIDKYFEPVVIERYTSTYNDFGEEVKTWTTHLTIQGRLRPLNGTERFSADKETLFATHRLYCFPADIKETDRVKYDNKYYNIKFVSDVMNFDILYHIDCELVQ